MLPGVSFLKQTYCKRSFFVQPGHNLEQIQFPTLPILVSGRGLLASHMYLLAAGATLILKVSVHPREWQEPWREVSLLQAEADG